ncbi:MAG: HigA family addiction module antidote protein [Alphaproteobacteria bacterium]|nr:HigA family addiction module antidote protein [Alphaproteobacteria bacterium]
MTNLDLITPGTILWEEFMVPLEISQNQMARDLDITVGRINDIIHGKRSITADTALRFSKYFGTSAEFWLNLQDDFDLRKIRRTVWPTIEPRIRAYSPQSLKKRGQRGLKWPAARSNNSGGIAAAKSSKATLPHALKKSAVKPRKPSR